MNEKEIAFIMCVNNERQAEESVYYIENLNMPDGYQKDIIAVRGAESMTAGYNAAMLESKAKYKVYLHQDTCIINKNFIEDVLRCFKSDEQIGMLGCVGCDAVPMNGWVVAAWNVGTVFHNCIPAKMERRQNADKTPIEVEALDGLMLVTSKDIRWREDLFDGWDFYDVSQCFEMKRAGYKVVVPYQEQPWCYHDNHYSKMTNYQKYCRRMVDEYQDIKAFSAAEFSDNRKELESIKEEVRKELCVLVNQENRKALLEIFGDEKNRGWLHLKEFEVLTDIVCAEYEEGTDLFWKKGEGYETINARIQELHFILKRAEFQVGAQNQKLFETIKEFGIQAVKAVLWAYTQEPERIWYQIQGEDWQDSKTEAYAELRAQQAKEWKERCEEPKQRYLALIEKWLISGTPEDKKELQKLFSDETFLQIFGHENEIAELKTAVKIYELECRNQIAPTIFDSCDNGVKGVRELLRGLRFLLWRKEFVGDEETVELLKKYVAEHKISHIMLEYMIHIASVHREGK